MPDTNIIFKTSTSKTIDDLLKPDGTANISGYTDNNNIQHTGVAITPGTIYFTSDGHIIYDLDSTHRLWMSKEAYSAIYAKDISDTADIATLIASHAFWADVHTDSDPNDMTQPTFNTASFIASHGSAKKATLQYNATTETLNFVFT